MASPADEIDSAELQEFFERYLSDPKNRCDDVTNVVRETLDAHFGVDATTLPTVEESWRAYKFLPRQMALDELLAEPGCESRVLGVRCPSVPPIGLQDLTLSRVLCRPNLTFAPPVLTPPDYVLVPSGVDESLPCLRQGLILFRNALGPAAIWVHPGASGRNTLEIVAPTLEHADALLDRVLEASARLAPFRGQAIKVENSLIGPIITFLPRPQATTREEVILPPGLLDQIERHSLGAVKARDALLDSGRHLKRGIMLHGPPGTGKTHTIKYLTGHLPHATVVIMSAARMHSMSAFTEVIDDIVPAIVVLDDVDLIAQNRDLAFNRGALFTLLDVLDGIREDEDLLFVMTTNRPDEIEPAILSRPGRIDQAIEVPLPDADCRSRLFDLYCAGVDVVITDEERAGFLERTDGVTAAFIREALRRATVAAMREEQDTWPVKITGKHLGAALDDLLDPDSPLTSVLLGTKPRHALPTINLTSANGVGAE